jgi:tRNA nucleotidyltransferase (CCA-adding enzyme)
MNERGEIFDFFDGVKDLEYGALRATSPAFSEDPLRVLRGMQFAGRFGFVMDSATLQLCRNMMGNYHALPKERVFEEWWKWASKSMRPSMGLDVLVQTGWITLFPQLNDLIGLQQDRRHHPEGDVWTHTKMVCDEAEQITNRDKLDERDRGVLMFAALCHDLGKATTTQVEDDRITSRGHDKAGGPLTEMFLDSIGAPKWLKDSVVPLVIEHMAHVHVPEDQLTTRVVRRLANRLSPSTMAMWSRICEADHGGRHPLPRGNPVKAWMKVAEPLQVINDRPRPILMGRHLLALGMKPGVEMGRITKGAFEAQLDGVFDNEEGALAWAKARM